MNKEVNLHTAAGPYYEGEGSVCTKSGHASCPPASTNRSERGEAARIPIEKECTDYYIDIHKEEGLSSIDLTSSMNGSLLLLIGSSVMGHGDDQQGSSLMKTFFYTLIRMETVPRTMIFLNSGVFLVCEGSPVLEYIRILHEKGTEILVNCSCMDHYQLQDKQGAGTLCNMYTITEKILEAGRLISI